MIGDIYKDFLRAQEKASGVDEWKLAGAGLVSEYLLNNGSEETSALTAPWISILGFDSVPELGLNGEDMDAVHAIISRKLQGEAFDKVLEDHDFRFGYGGRQVCPQVVLDTANRVWANMVQRNGSMEGQERKQMPQATLEGHYLTQERPSLEPQRGGTYKTLNSGLVVPV